MTYEQQIREAARARRAKFFPAKNTNIATPRNVPAEEPRSLDKEHKRRDWLSLDDVSDLLLLDVGVIRRAVSQASGVSEIDLVSQRRTRSINLPRQVAMTLAAMLTKASLPQIGRRYGGRDHTTVLHAVRKVTAALVSGDRETRRLVIASIRKLPTHRARQHQIAREVRAAVEAKNRNSPRKPSGAR